MSIREKFRDWLLGDELRDLKWAKEELEDARIDFVKSKAAMQLAKNNYTLAQNEAKDSKKLVNRLMDIGVDVGFHSDDHSWAVVCIKGHPEYVKFMPLRGKDVKNIIDFLKQFQGSNQVVDSPFYFKDMINHYVTNYGE